MIIQCCPAEELSVAVCIPFGEPRPRGGALDATGPPLSVVGSFTSAVAPARLMNRDGRKHGTERHIPGHLQTEIDHFLRRNRNEASHGSRAQPIRLCVISPVTEAAAHLTHEKEHRDHDGHAQQQTPFRGELQIVVVGLEPPPR